MFEQHARKIATYTVSAPERFRTTEEVACWYTEIEVQPGDYDYLGTVLPDGRIEDHQSGGSSYWLTFGVTLPGVVTGAHYPSLFGGLAMTSGERPEMIGREQSYTVRGAAYSLAHSKLEEARGIERLGTRERATTITLDDEVIALYKPFEYDGEATYTAGLYLREVVTPEMQAASDGVSDALDGKPARILGGNLDFGYRLGYLAGYRRFVEEQERLGYSDACEGDGGMEHFSSDAWAPEYADGYGRGATARRKNVTQWIERGCIGMDCRKTTEGQPILTHSRRTDSWGVWVRETREVLFTGERREAERFLAERLAKVWGVEIKESVAF